MMMMLTMKVVKHWFRNTLFKERQRCKDSPYNFSVPPAACDQPPASSAAAAEQAAESVASGHVTAEVSARSAGEDRDRDRRSDGTTTAATESSKYFGPSSLLPQSNSSVTPSPSASPEAPPHFPRGCYFGMPVPSYPPAVLQASPSYPPGPQASPASYPSGLQASPASYPPAVPQALPLLPSVMTPVLPPGTANVGGVGASHIVNVTSSGAASSAAQTHHPTTTPPSRGGHGKRASRTHFSDEQVASPSCRCYNVLFVYL